MNCLIAHIAKVLLLCLIMLSPLETTAQKGKLKKAKKAYDNFEFPKAIEKYSDILSDTTTLKRLQILRARLYMAEAYRKMNKIGEATRLYEEIVSSKLKRPEYVYHLARALMANGRYDEAKKWFKDYALLKPDDERSANMIRACDLIEQSFEIPSPFKIEHLPFNSANSDFAAAPWDKGLLFTSGRKTGLFAPKFEWNNAPFYDIYYTAPTDSGWTEAKSIKGSVNTRWHEGPAFPSQADSLLYFTRNAVYQGQQGISKAGVVKLNIYVAGFRKGKWIKTMETSLNHPQFSTAHPTLTADGNTMYFVSDKPGGSGGTDIYMAERIAGTRWSRPVNLGEKVNSAGNEMFPFIWQDSLLFFSTDGQTLFGGLDILMSARNRFDEWTTPQNLGYPINSTGDDFGFYIDSSYSTGYLSSNRDGGFGDDDIYKFTRNTIRLKGLVVEARNHNVLPNTSIKLNFLASGLPAATCHSSEGGYFECEVIPGVGYNIQCRLDGYIDHIDSIFIEPDDQEVLLPVFLKKFEIPTMVYLAFRSDTNHPLPDTIPLSIRKVGDSIGNHYLIQQKAVFKLTRDSVYILETKIEGYYTWRDTISTLDIAKPQVVQHDVYMHPVRVGDKIIHHVWLDENYEATLKTGLIIKTLKDFIYQNPDALFEVGAHTDTRGTAAFNLEYANRIAHEFRTLILKEASDTLWISAKGYGKSKPLNDCLIRKNCTDEEHAENRRIEIRVVAINRTVE